MGSFCFVTLPQTTALIKVWGNLVLIVENLLPNLAVTMSEVKVIITWLNKKVLAKLLDEMASDWFREKTAHERQVMLKYANITRVMTITGLMCTAFCVVFCFTPFVFGILARTITNLTDEPGRRFPLQAVYLYDTSSIYIYYLTIISQAFGISFGAFCYSGIDVIFAMLVPTAHLRNVQIIESIVSWIMLGVTGSFAILFSTVGFQIVQEFTSAISDGTVPQVFYHMNCLFTSVFSMFVYSWVGEHLVTQSDSIHTAIYSCNWTNLTPEEASQLIIILARSQHPLQLTAGRIVPLTMNTYLSLLKSCGGYISCLLAVRK